ncbi:MAG: hydroxylamine reductase [Candidatus Fermentibacteria bacterium]|nr:hydroxylamine reductase [Candidatus Fermentibacteria bacterium]
MSMFCYQCQETLGNNGCTVNGICGKKGDTAILQDLLIYTAKGISVIADKAGKIDKDISHFVTKALFTTVTNVNFDDDNLIGIIKQGLALREEIKARYGVAGDLHDSAVWTAETKEDFLKKAETVGVLSTENEDVRSLRELLTYGLKGVAAYADHAYILGYEDRAVFDFMIEGLASTTKDLSVDEMIALVMRTGEAAVGAMAILDKANTNTYGNPEITEVNIGVRNNPAILISGHDLKDMEELLKQTQGTGVDVYTHGEMLPANYYPAFKNYDNFVGNYGNAWWLQDKEFASFNGPVVMTTNCLVPPKQSYIDRVFNTGNVAFPGVKTIADRPENGQKDFSEVIAMAKTLPSPTEIETGAIVGGFAHNQVFALADKVVEAVKSGAIRKFIVMAGCDGRHKSRDYYREFAEALPKDTVILTAGCAKFRYNKLNLGDIGGIPRVLDAGQCNDSYSLALIAMKLKEVFELEDINDLPIVYNIAWYEQKAVTVLLALLHLGVKNIHLGPTLPAFLSPTVVNVLVENFGIAGIGTVDDDIKNLIG